MGNASARATLVLLAAFAAAFAGMASGAPEEEGASPGPLVHVITWDDAVTPVTTSAIHEALDTARAGAAAALVIRLNTPGGLLDATRDIVSDLLDAEIPVIVWVAPSGARAASAGAFLTMAGHVAAMAPGTNIGAASPVNMGGGDIDSTMAHKLFHDTAAFSRTIAEKRGRNVEWAERAVREAVSATESEAVELGVVDFVAESLPDLLAKATGRTVTLPDGERVLDLENARVVERELSLRFKLLSLLANPNIAYILMMLGVYGLFFELQSPGSIFPGVVGAVCLILALYSMQTVPMNVAGILLIVTGGILFILEAKIQSFGLLSIAAIAASILGAIMVFDSPEPALRASLGVVLPVTLVTILFFGVAVGLSIRTMRSQVTTGREGMIGQVGVVRKALEPRGTIEVHGELWNAVADGSVAEGESVEVTAVNGLLLDVRKKS
ncbi:nodulation protein NfeD [bacterium]|nr:nodulation protein NfeD [bacterium]